MWIIEALVFIVWGAVCAMLGAKYQMKVFAAEKAAEEEARVLYEAAKKRYRKKKDTTPPTT